MRRSRFKVEQIIQILKEADSGAAVEEVCRRHGIGMSSLYRWRHKYADMTVSEARRLRDLEHENARLRKLLADRDLEIDAMKEIVRKNS